MAQPSGSQLPSVKWLHQAAEQGETEQIRFCLSTLNTEDRRILLSSRVEIHGELPLHGAARGGRIDVLELLLPDTLQHLTDTQSIKDGWSSLHLAAAYGRAKVVQWLVVARMASLNLQDQDGNTPMHLAVTLGHKDVVRYLVNAKANLFSLNNVGMMPLSLCKDPAMFESLFSNYTIVSTSFNRTRPIREPAWPLDAGKRHILHYAAQFATDPNRIAALIAATGLDQLQEGDNQGDSFLHVAAKAGNVQVLRGLKKVDAVCIDVKLLVSDSGRNHLHSLGMYALLYNHREFFDELIAMGIKVEITLRHIIQGLMGALIDKHEIEDRLPLFADTLPTYLALYANKECIFNFLLETEVVSISQWDDQHKRTCLHWAVVDNRINIVEKICRCQQGAHLRPGIQDADGKTALQHAFKQKNHMIMDTLRSKPGFKEYEKKLENDREIYVQALNAILVGAALIASVTFAGWLQLPSKEFDTLAMKMFWASNCISFFTAVATMCVTITALVPTPRRYVGDIVNQLWWAIIMDAGLLALSLAAVMWAFAAAGFAALHDAQIVLLQGIMPITTAVGGFLCVVVWLAFVVQLYKSAPRKTALFALVVPSLPPSFSFWTHWWPASYERVRSRIGESSRFGYLSKLRSDLRPVRDEDLVVRYIAKQGPSPPSVHGGAPASNIIPLQNMQQILGKLDLLHHIEGKSGSGFEYMERTYKQKKNEIGYEQFKEGVNSRIMRHFHEA